MWTSAVFFAAGAWFGFFVATLMQAGKEDDPHAGRCGEQNDQLRHQHHQADGPDAKLTGRTILAAARKFLQWRAGKTHDKPVGKQSVKQLLRQDQGATNIEIEKTGIRDFKRILDKYGVDYAVTKNHDDPPRYLVFFKARDADTLTAAFKDYSAKLVQKEKRPSVLERLQQFKALAAELVPGKMLEKKQERAGR